MIKKIIVIFILMFFISACSHDSEKKDININSNNNFTKNINTTKVETRDDMNNKKVTEENVDIKEIEEDDNMDDEIKENFKKAPDFSLKDYNGNTLELGDFAGKNLIINSWAAWCPFCTNELVDFANIQKEFGDDIVIIAINRQESLKTSKKFSDKLNVTDDLVYLLDPSDSFYRSIGGFSMPETIFVDKDGNIVEHKRGPMREDEIRDKINNLFK